MIAQRLQPNILASINGEYSMQRAIEIPTYNVENIYQYFFTYIWLVWGSRF